MTLFLAGATSAADPPSGIGSETPARTAIGQIALLLLPLAAFGVYWVSSLILVARDGTTHYAADTWFYTELAKGSIFDRLADNYHLDRVFRFHPTTVVLAAAWMQVVAPLLPSVSPLQALKAMFAAAGAVGVWAAMRAFAAAVPGRYVPLFGAIYAGSLSVWYFSSIEESKIVSATLVALYIATYLHLRKQWTTRGAVLLTAILLLACLNESVAVILVVIPAVDILVQRGWDALRHGRWIALHALASPVAVAILETLMRVRTGAASSQSEGANHFSMLVHYISQNEYNLENLYEFALRWLFFSVAAPSRFARYWADASQNYGGDFEPLVANYLASPASAGLVVLFAAMLIASVLPRYRNPNAGAMAGILLALLAYSALRGTFFFVFIPYETLLFTPSVVLAHLLLIGMPFAASSFPAKGTLLAAFALLLLVVNGTFILGQ